MKKLIHCVLVYICHVQSLSLPGSEVFVVTPATKQSNEGRAAAAPFYYHNWIRRMDSQNVTTTQTPDLIFAEFESGNKLKSIRNLLAKEVDRTSPRPIYVPEDKMQKNYGLPAPAEVTKVVTTTPDMTDYFALYNNIYNVDSAPVFMPSTTFSTTSTTSTSAPAVKLDKSIEQEPNVQNIWHIIDSQKFDQYSGKWEEVANEEKDETNDPSLNKNNNEEGKLDNNFALPGFETSTGSNAENESRAIRTEPNMRFPYINLKPFQIKTQKKPNQSSSKNNMLNSLDNFQDNKSPVRGEAQEVVPSRQSIDRYNPAQPYIPQPSYASKSKQSSPDVPPLGTVVSNLVPPPPPPPPIISAGDFPAPTSYESFPPFAPIEPPSVPAPPKPSIAYEPPVFYATEDSDDPPDVGYKIQPPAQSFYATPPYTKPASGYSYDKPPPVPESAPIGYSYDKPPIYSPPDDDKTDFQGYEYSKPVYKPYGHYYTTTTTTETPRVNRYSYYYLGKKLYYLPLYFSVYFIVYVGALIIKAVLRHKIVYPNSWRPNDQTAGFFSKRSIDSYDLSNESLHEITGRITNAIDVAGKQYFSQKRK